MDKTTKVLLALIALALWMLALNPWLRPAPVQAADPPEPQTGIEIELSRVRDAIRDVDISIGALESVLGSKLDSIESAAGSIARGTCSGPVCQ